MKDLFKTQRDEPARAAMSPDDGEVGSGADKSDGADARSMAVAGTLKSALRVACDVTAKI